MKFIETAWEWVHVNDLIPKATKLCANKFWPGL